MSRQSSALKSPTLLFPVAAPPRVSQSLQSESCKPTRKSNSSTLPGRVTIGGNGEDAIDFCETIAGSGVGGGDGSGRRVSREFARAFRSCLRAFPSFPRLLNSSNILPPTSRKVFIVGAIIPSVRVTVVEARRPFRLVGPAGRRRLLRGGHGRATATAHRSL